MPQLPAFLFASLLLTTLLGSCASENLEDLTNAPITAPCDTTAVATYSGVVRGVIERNHCLECHTSRDGFNSGTLASGFNFETVAGLQASDTTGRLLPAIEHQPGRPQMPAGGQPKMSDCDIVRIKQWVRRGAPAD